LQHLQKTRSTSFKPKAFLFLFPGALFNSSRCLRASVAAAPPPIFRTLFQVPYPATPLFAAHTKTPGVWGYSSHFGTHRSPPGTHRSQQFRTLSATHLRWGRDPHSLLHYLLTSLLRCSFQSPVTNLQSPIVVSFHPVNILLNEVECRVLGALVNACNQKSNRDPVMNLDEAAVRQALHSLDGQSLVRYVSASDSRVTKYEHRLQEAFNFYRHEIAILCVLLLRGPQTPGELRTRAERMHPFDDLGAVQSSLQHLMKREPPLVKILPRQPGTKEARYAHLFSGDVEVSDARPAFEATAASLNPDGERIAIVEEKVAGLQKEIAELRQQFAVFRKQVE